MKLKYLEVNEKNAENNLILVKEKKVDNKRYVLAISKLFCEKCDLFHEVKFIDMVNSEIHDYVMFMLNILGFEPMGESDFFLKYEIEQGFKKFSDGELNLFEKELKTKDDNYVNDISEVCSYSIYNQPETSQGSV